MTITKITLENFTAFSYLDFEPTSGINVLIGPNGTGKTHLMKVAYAACDISKTRTNFGDKLVRVFLPSGHALGRLVKRGKGSMRGSAEIRRGDLELRISFSNHTIQPDSRTVIQKGEKNWQEWPVESVFIPVKEMLSNGPGFRALYSRREIHFDETYVDILDRAYLPARRGPVDSKRKKLLKELQRLIDGKVSIKNQEFFLRNKQGNLEFTLLAEGIRKLGLLWLLIQNGTLLKGSVLFWDEPETNLNPKLFGPLIEILLELQRMGVQVFLATHDYVILKEIDLRSRPEDKIKFHSLYRNDDQGEIQYHSSSEYLEIHPNAILATFADLYDREIQRSLGVKAK